MAQLTINSDKKGVIYISHTLALANPEIYKAICNYVLILDLQDIHWKGFIRIVCIHESFNVVQKGERIPKYRVLFQADEHQLYKIELIRDDA